MQNVRLNLIPGSVLPVVNVSQYDKKREFTLTIYDGATAYNLAGKSVQIRGTKPDGNGFAYDQTDGVVSIMSNVVTIFTTQQMTAVGGPTMAELRITSGDTIVGTLNFIIMVEPSALSDDTPISDTEIPAIERDFEAALAEAEADALKAEGYAVGTQDGVPAQSGEPYYQDNAKYYKEQAEAAASGGGADALKAEGYAVGTQNGVPVTSGSPYYHNNAAYYEGEASTSATNAATSETNAGLSETAAGNSATSAAADALVSEGWAVGKQNGTPVTSGSPYYQNNAEYYKDQAAQYAAGGLIFKGSVAFASIPTTGMVNGDEYNITDDFTTDNRFIEGSGISVKAGTNIAWIGGSTNKWDLLATGGGGASTLDDLSDVTLTSPSSGQILEYDGSKWANANLPTVPSDLDDLGDVDLTTPTSGQVLKFDGSKWVNGNGGGGASDLDDLGDVTITTPTDGQVLTYDAASQKWVNANGGGGGGFDYKDWLTAGDLNPMSYADLAAVLADEKAVRKLMTIHLAVDYLASQDLGADVLTILSDNLCAKWINLRDYAIDTLYGNQIFATQMDAIGKYGYGEWAKLSESPETWAPKGNVPIMTSNTAPYGTASAYQVFDGNASTTASGTDFSYQFVNPICPKDFICKNASGQDVTGGTLQASNDGSTWSAPVDGEYYFNLRVHFAASTTVATVQFYGREMKVSVPVMTSNTAPYGEAFGGTGGYATNIYKAFDGDLTAGANTGIDAPTKSRIGYKFVMPVRAKKIMVCMRVDYDTKFTFQGSNDGTNWTDLSSELTYVKTGTKYYAYYDVNDNNGVYKYYGFYGAVKSSGAGLVIYDSQIWGFDYSEYDWDADNPRHYLYDHGVEFVTFDTPPRANNVAGPNSYTIDSPTVDSNMYGMWATSATIDLTPYDLMRICIGNELHSDLNSSGNPKQSVTIQVNTEKTAYNSGRIANRVVYVQDGDLAFNEYLDISAVNQSAYPNIVASTDGAKGEITEWWLE